MNKVVFSSWADSIIDNRGLEADKYKDAENLGIPLEYDKHQIKAFMSWNGVVLADGSVNIIDMLNAYIKEVARLSCGQCSVGYLGIKAIKAILGKITGGAGAESDVQSLKRLAANVKENTRCDFCASAVTPVLDTINYFSDEFDKLITGKGSIPQSSYVTRVTAPCMAACPAHQDIPGYIELIKNHRYEDALNLIRETNCLPGVTGRACVAFCEAKCVRSDIDSPLAIRALKRFPADYETNGGIEAAREKGKGGGAKVAVIGAGPAGLAASYNLARMGYKVTIYDEQSSGGGMALVGIPSYRLPKNVLDNEVDIIKNLGIEIKYNIRIGRDITLKELNAEGYRAIFIASGAHLDRESDVEDWGKGYEGVMEGVEFLRGVNLGQKVAPRDKVIIIGGGNVAVDCARTCVRLGFKDVTIVYRRSRAEMPGRKEEISAAEQEGVKLQFLAVPRKVLARGNSVVGAECIRMELGEPDASGRRRPLPVSGSEFVIEADMVISAIGEMPDLSGLTGGSSVNISKQGTIEVDDYSMQTGEPGVFSGGDCVTGPATLVEAVAAGNKAAKNIDEYIKSGSCKPSDMDKLATVLNGIELGEQRGMSVIAQRQRQSPPELKMADRMRDFSEAEQCFTPGAVAQEAGRCLRCYRVMVVAQT